MKDYLLQNIGIVENFQNAQDWQNKKELVAKIEKYEKWRINY